MAYLPVRFPLLIGRDPVGGPAFLTDIAKTASGFEQRDQRWPTSMHKFDFSHSIKSTAMFREAGAHFRQARGRLHKFRVRDWGDFTCQRKDGKLSQITATTFQAFKVYGDDLNFQELRKITRVFPSSISVWKDNVLLTSPSAYQVNEETGIVTFTAAPGAAVLECGFMFDVPCRYDTDELQATLVQYGANESFYSWTSVPLLEQRE